MIQFMLDKERLVGHTEKSSAPRCGRKSLRVHMDYSTVFTTVNHFRRSRLGAGHQSPPAAHPSLKGTQPLLYLHQGLGPPVAEDPNVPGTHRKPKAPGEVNVPQQVFHQRQRSLLQYLLSGNALLSGITHTNSGTLRKFLHKGRSP